MSPGGPVIRSHYAVIRRHASRLARHDADTDALWRQLLPTFNSQVLGPCFESAGRYWATHFADAATLGGSPHHVGPTTLMLSDGSECQLDVVVAAAGADVPSERTVLAIGEAKAGERLDQRQLQRLEAARSALGARASEAKLLLFGVEIAPQFLAASARRGDVEVIDPGNCTQAPNYLAPVESMLVRPTLCDLNERGQLDSEGGLPD